MSHLCPDRRGVGYSIGRSSRGTATTRTASAVRPHSHVEAPSLPLIVKFGIAGRSVAVFTELLAPSVITAGLSCW